MDEECQKENVYGLRFGFKFCFMVEDEFFDIYFNEGNFMDDEVEEMIFGCGVCECIRVKYDDGFIEEQWFMVVDDDEDFFEVVVVCK